MKIRTGFVSNSSSSSFLVWFDTVPQNSDELKKLLFGNELEIEMYDYVVSTRDAADAIWHDMESQPPVTLEDMRNELQPLAYNKVFDAWERKGKQDHWYLVKDKVLRQKLQDEENADIEAELDRLVQQYQQLGGHLYRFTYSDNDGELSTVLEHGDVFKNVRHVRISHH